jgi:hypothetical protein
MGHDIELRQEEIQSLTQQKESEIEIKAVESKSEAVPYTLMERPSVYTDVAHDELLARMRA